MMLNPALFLVIILHDLSDHSPIFAISKKIASQKILERILYDRVYFYLQEHKLLSKYQFGFSLDLQLHMQLRIFTPIF